MPETGVREDPFRSFNFVVDINGIAVAGFSEVTGLMTDGDVIEYREGTDVPLTNRKLPGLYKQSNIVLSKGKAKTRVLWEWRLAILNGRVDRRNGAIVLMDELRQRVAEWRFENGWPVKYEAPTLNAKNNEVAVEKLEIAHEGLRLR
ncbi:phage tail protein [Mycolicibacterium sp. CR10]|uniref:phage tail protein n=1 Tax=Mycolicibacterium sp. CR10 TaxID=2562314 RepID=UPI0010BFFFA4|nr:phage tail protein [Mycolicibacterium sp. CR10]